MAEVDDHERAMRRRLAAYPFDAALAWLDAAWQRAYAIDQRLDDAGRAANRSADGRMLVADWTTAEKLLWLEAYTTERGTRSTPTVV